MSVQCLRYAFVLFLTVTTSLLSETAFAGVTNVVASSDAANLSYQYTYSGSPAFLRLYLDTDQNSSTGYSSNGIGGDFLIENDNLYKYSGSNGSWAWSFVRYASMVKSGSSVKWTIPLTSVYSPARIKYFGEVGAPTSSSSVFTQVLSVSAPAISLTVAGAPNLPLNGTTTLVTVGFTSGTPTKVELSRDGYAPFAVWPGGSFFTLAGDGKSLNGQWCITSPCWGGVQGPHVLNVLATYADGSTKSASVSVNVSDSISQPQPLPSPTPTSAPTPTPTPTPISTPTPTPTPTPTTTSAPLGRTFYLSPNGNDSNPGTQSAPWRTIMKAGSSVAAGDTVILMDGNYQEAETYIKSSGTASKPITFKAQNKWRAVIYSISGCRPGLSIYASYITLQDLRFSVSPASPSCSAGYQSTNSHIRAWNSANATPSNQTTGYAGFRMTGLKLDTGFRHEGIKSNQDYTIIENSEVGNSIELFNNKDSIIRNNVVTGQDYFAISIFVKGGVRNTQIYNNVIRNKVSNGQAIIIGGYSCDSCFYDTSAKIEAYNTVAYNNIIINESNGAMAGLMFQGAKDSAFINNVVINGMIAATVGGHNTGHQAPTTNPTFKNNIVLCGGGSLTSSNPGWTYSGAMNLDYNLFHNCSSVPSQAHPVSGDPRFVNTSSDWHLQPGSPAINSGTAVPSFPRYGGGSMDLSRDKDGVLRSSPWDLGVYNVTP